MWFLFEIKLKITILDINLKRIKMKIKMIQPAPDKNDASKMYSVGDVVDLGAERNRSAVNRRLAVWVDEKESEKVSIPTDKKKKVSKAGSEVIETKKSE